MLPLFRQIYEDELDLGWVLQLAELNGCSPQFFTEYYFSDTYGSMSGMYRSFCRMDHLNGLYRLSERFHAEGLLQDPEKIIRNNTMTYAAYPFISAGRQAGITQRLLNNYTKGFVHRSYGPANIKALKICPDCLDEDVKEHGIPYFHTWHHFPGSTVCAVHGTSLFTLKEQWRGTSLRDPDTYLRLRKDRPLGAHDFEISRMMYDLYTSPMNTDWSQVISAIRMKLAESGLTVSELNEMVSGQGYTPYFLKGDTGRKIRMLLYQPGTLTAAVSLILLLWENAADLKSYMLCRGLAANDDDMLKYLTCGKCGKNYLIHPFAEKAECGCPQCDSLIEPKEYIEKQLSHCGDGAYMLMEPFQGYQKRCCIQHLTCGRSVKIAPGKRIWDGHKCVCQKKGYGCRE